MARAVLQGLSFGTADEAEAALRSLMGDETYAENLSDIRSEIKILQKRILKRHLV